MMRRTRFNKTSSRVVDYLVEQRGLTQDEIARILRVDKSFVSRVRSAEREFSPDQIGTIADALGVPMGALLMAAVPLAKNLPPDRQKIVDMCVRLLGKTDAAITALRARPKAG